MRYSLGSKPNNDVKEDLQVHPTCKNNAKKKNSKQNISKAYQQHIKEVLWLSLANNASRI